MNVFLNAERSKSRLSHVLNWRRTPLNICHCQNIDQTLKYCLSWQQRFTTFLQQFVKFKVENCIKVHACYAL